MCNVSSITDNVFKNPLTPIPVACVLITAVVIGALALLEVGPFASFAYSDIVAGCSFAFTGFMILCIAAVKGCIILPVSIEELPKEIKQNSSDTDKHVEEVRQVFDVEHSDTPIVRGKISIKSYLTAGALGKDTPRLYYPSSEVKRVDGKDWKTFPNEMMIECQLFDIEGSTQLTSLLLPFCLFVNHDDYCQWKKEGELVIFLFEGQRYELIIDQTESTLPDMPLDEMISTCERQFYENKGRSILFADERQKDETSYRSPMDVQRHLNAVAQGEKLKQQFKEKFPKEENPPPLDFPAKPKCAIYKYDKHLHLKYEVPGVGQDSIRYFFSETSFAIYAPKKDQTPPEQTLWGRGRFEIKAQDSRDQYINEYLIIIDYDDTYNPEKIKEAKKQLKDGYFHMTVMI